MSMLKFQPNWLMMVSISIERQLLTLNFHQQFLYPIEMMEQLL